MSSETQVMPPPVAHELARPAHDRHQWKVASRALLRFQYHFAHLPHAKLRDPGHHNLPHGAPTGPTGHLRDLRGTCGLTDTYATGLRRNGHVGDHRSRGALGEEEKKTQHATCTPRGFGAASARGDTRSCIMGTNLDP